MMVMRSKTDNWAGRGELRCDEPMGRHTSWRVGGAADYFYKPADIADCSDYLQQLPEDAALFWLGLGSNLLVRDGGIRGHVICTSGVLNHMAVLDSGLVRIEAGVSCAKVARFCANAGLMGTEFLIGIPGTMGGALAMNAGAFGGETWPLVSLVETIDRRGNIKQRTPDEYQIAYREVNGPKDEWFVAAHLSLVAGDSEQALVHAKSLLTQRNETQPTGQPSGGSVFRNPDNDYAGRLIEASGLKGFCIGGACVSTKHANFIVNNDAASAEDIEALIDHVAVTVERQQGVVLMREIHVAGERLDRAEPLQ